MKIYLKLQTYLQKVLNNTSRAKIAEDMQLTEFQLKNLLNNETPKIDRRHLAKVCRYLVDMGLADQHELPAGLFRMQPEHFWQLLTERKRVEMFMGVRRDDHWNDQVVIAADSVIQANFLYRMSQVSRTGVKRRKSRPSKSRQIIDPRLVRAWGVNGSEDSDIQAEAKRLFRGFLKSHEDEDVEDNALIGFGSVKSNPVIEPSIAWCFRRAKPFISEDDVDDAQERTCPFVVLYRDTDPHPPSVCGGTRLSRKDPGSGPGIYYEEPDGKWHRIAWDEHSDAALVFYRLDKVSGQLIMVMGGFSGRGTRCLAELLRGDDADVFWPPVSTNDYVEVGAFIVHFTLRPRNKRRHQQPLYQRIANTQVIRLSNDVVERRIRIGRRRSKRSDATKATASKPTVTKITKSKPH